MVMQDVSSFASSSSSSFTYSSNSSSGFFQNHMSSSPTLSVRFSINRFGLARTNSLVQIGTVEGDLVKRALLALIRYFCLINSAADLIFSPALAICPLCLMTSSEPANSNSN
ncbi:Uncharacterized protein Adt_30256 [Abeliophyllum distichum]|uniref:Uncharacterized protein n=1 Tax=Abeliophyllum distichum TaxID=126358 RepID=A0ABD1RAR3_9LAMI